MVKSVPLPQLQLCHCLPNCLKGPQGGRLQSLFQCFPVLTVSKSPTIFSICPSRCPFRLPVRPQRTSYFPSLQQPFTYLKFVIVPVSVIAPSLLKFSFFPEVAFSRALHRSCCSPSRFSAPAMPSLKLSRARLVHVASMLHCRLCPGVVVWVFLQQHDIFISQSVLPDSLLCKPF